MEFYISARKFKKANDGSSTLHNVYQTLADDVTLFRAKGVDSGALSIVHQSKAWVKSALEAGDGKNVVFYVHGFRTHFTDARKRTRKIRKALNALNFDPSVVCFDWPSESKLSLREFITRAQYDRVRGMADHASRWLITKGFKAFWDHDPTLKIHVVAHSMGATLLADGLCRIGDGSGDIHMNGKKLEGIALVAPDEDREFWTGNASRATGVAAQSKRVRNYYSNQDMVLDISGKRFGQHTERSGRFGLKPSLPNGIVDVACHHRYMKIKKFDNPETIESHNWYFDDRDIFHKEMVGLFSPALGKTFPDTRRALGNGDEALITQP